MRRNPQPEPWQIWTGAVLGTIGLTALGYGVVSLFTRGGLPRGIVPPQQIGVPFAQIKGRRTWPILTAHERRGEVAYVDVDGNRHGKYDRRFGAPRDGGRQHAGIDLFSYNGDVVVAIGRGTVIATQGFELGTDAILVDHGGAVVLYGEVDPGSWKEFGIGVGSKVSAGDPIARVGCMVGSWNDCSSHMLHLETYAPGTTQNHPWYDAPPPELLDPTFLLLSASSAEANP